MLLSETKRGRSWIANFLEDDQSTAATLLNSLRIASAEEFRSGLLYAARHLAASLDGAVAIHPVRDKPIYVKEYERHWEPDVARRVKPDDGSEWLTIGVGRSVSRQSVGDVLNYPSVKVMTTQKVRNILLLDDYCGSGDTVVKCIQAWFRNPTIKSWHSFGWIRFSYATFTASVAGRKRIDKLGVFGDRVAVAEPSYDFESADWETFERASIRSLCRNYAHRAANPLGYAGSAGLFAVSHTVPNNLPAIFTQKRGSRNQDWQFLFRRNSDMTPDELDELVGYFPPSTALQARATPRGLRLRRSFTNAGAADMSVLLPVLALCSRRGKTFENLSRECRLPVRSVRALLAQAAGMGLVDPRSTNLTDAGFEEVANTRIRLPRRVVTQDMDRPYYPRQLRGGR